MLKTLKTPRFEHYEVEYWGSGGDGGGGNAWACLGNGRTEREVRAEAGEEVDLAPFIRDSDGEWGV